MYITQSEVSTYLSGSSVESNWTALSDNEKNWYIKYATDSIDKFDYRFVGHRVTVSNRSAFPRDFSRFILDSDYKLDLFALYNRKIPEEVKTACFEIIELTLSSSGFKQLSDMQDVLGATKVSVGSISVDMVKTSKAVDKIIYDRLGYYLRSKWSLRCLF